MTGIFVIIGIVPYTQEAGFFIDALFDNFIAPVS